MTNTSAQEFPACGPFECVEQEVRETVFTSTSIFGRLVAVSTLRDRNNIYEHELLSSKYGTAEIDRKLHSLHREAFNDWLCLSLRQQTADLKIYLAHFGEERPFERAVLVSASDLIPAEHIRPERELFLQDLNLVVPFVYGK